MLEFMRNKLVSVALKNPDTLVVHGVLDDSIYSLELDLEVDYPELTVRAITGRWKRWTTPECPKSLEYLDQARGFCLGPGIEDTIHKTIGRTSCRHFANLLIECAFSVREASRAIRWQEASKADPSLDMAAFLRSDSAPVTGGRGDLPAGGSPGTAPEAAAGEPSPDDRADNRPAPRAEAGAGGREPAGGAGPGGASRGSMGGKSSWVVQAHGGGDSPEPPDRGGFVLDLHLHTFPASTCASSTVEEMVLEARRLGLGGICLTDHNHLWPEDRVRDLADRHGIRVFRGNEIVTDQGDMLVFGFYEEVQGIIRLQTLKERVDAAGGFIIAAHPFRGFLTFGVGQLGLTPEKAMERDMFRHVHAIETLNGKVTESENSLAAKVARGLNLPATGGSDAHDVSTLGVYATRFEEALEGDLDLVRALRSGRFRPVRRSTAP
jgi:predicted metal-dependent phosphoesterase TrpH